MKRIFEIPDDIRAIDRQVVDAERPPSEIIEQLLISHKELKGLAIALAKLAKEHLAEARVNAEAIAGIKWEEDHHKNIAKLYEDAAMSIMVDADERHIDDEVIPLKIVSSPPSVAIIDAAEIPTQLTRVIPETREPDKAAIRRQLLAGEDVPGAKLIENVRLKY